MFPFLVVVELSPIQTFTSKLHMLNVWNVQIIYLEFADIIIFFPVCIENGI